MMINLDVIHSRAEQWYLRRADEWTARAGEWETTARGSVLQLHGVKTGGGAAGHKVVLRE